MRLNVVFLEGLQQHNVLIMFLFSIKHSHFLLQKLLKTLIIFSDFCMVWKSYCGQFSASQKQLLVSDYGLN